jgi:hypothetical protein
LSSINKTIKHEGALCDCPKWTQLFAHLFQLFSITTSTHFLCKLITLVRILLILKFVTLCLLTETAMQWGCSFCASNKKRSRPRNRKKLWHRFHYCEMCRKGWSLQQRNAGSTCNISTSLPEKT